MSGGVARGSDRDWLLFNADGSGDVLFDEWSVSVTERTPGRREGSVTCWGDGYNGPKSVRLSAEQMRAFAAALLEAAEVLDR